MNYFMFHLGDWDTRTRVLSPTEKGVYIDLITLYYTLERPLMRSECERIARGYAQNERDAQEFVLDRFFERDGDTYRNSRCDDEIARANEKASKAAKSARIRWERKKKDSTNGNSGQTQSEGNADAMRTDMRSHSERTANAMLSNTPILQYSNKYEVVPNGTTRQNADLGSAEAAPANPPEAASPASPESGVLFEEETKTLRFDRKGAIPPCPYQKIVEAFHETLPELPRVNKLSPARQKVVQARWKDVFVEESCKTADECLENFKFIFGMVRESDFLMGRTPRAEGHANWTPTFMWLMKQENFLKVINREYQR